MSNPLKNHYFAQQDNPPMDFLILRPLFPKTRYHFFEGGVGRGGVGSRVCAQKAPSSGEAVTGITGRMVT